MGLIKWKKPSGLEIETNDMLATVEYVKTLGWERIGGEPVTGAGTGPITGAEPVAGAVSVTGAGILGTGTEPVTGTVELPVANEGSLDDTPERESPPEYVAADPEAA